MCLFTFRDDLCCKSFFFSFVIRFCKNGSNVEGSEVWAKRAPICDDMGDVGDGGFVIDNIVYWSLAFMICICLLRAFVSCYLICPWSKEDVKEGGGEANEESVVLVEKDEF